MTAYRWVKNSKGDYEPEALGGKPAAKPEVTKDYVYHGTTQGALRKIVTEGIKPTSGGQVSLSKTEQYAMTYAERKGGTHGIILRIQDKGQFLPDERITVKGDFFTKDVIRPSDIEVKMPNGSWAKLIDVDVSIGTPEPATPKTAPVTPEVTAKPEAETGTPTKCKLRRGDSVLFTNEPKPGRVKRVGEVDGEAAKIIYDYPEGSEEWRINREGEYWVVCKDLVVV